LAENRDILSVKFGKNRATANYKFHIRGRASEKYSANHGLVAGFGSAQIGLNGFIKKANSRKELAIYFG